MPSLIDEQTQFVDSAGAPIVNGSVYIGTRNQNPVTNAITIYSDRALTTAISNPQTTDANGRTTNKIWVPGRYSIRVDNSAGVQQYQELDAGEEESAGNTKLTNVQGTNTITAEGTPTAVISLTDAQTYIFRAANAPTGACTLQIDLTAAKSIKKKNNTDIQANDWAAGQYVTVVYDATDDVFEMTTAPSIETFSSITLTGDIVLEERADHANTPTAGSGQIWARNDAPASLIYTDDAGVDRKLSTVDAAITGHIRAGNMQILNGEQAGSSFSVSGLTESTWATVGPTGSTNEWTILDNLPASATILLAELTIASTTANTNQLSVQVFFTYGDDATPSTSTNNNLLGNLNFDPNAASEFISNRKQILIPLGAGQDFQVNWTAVEDSGTTITLYYRGFLTD